MESLATQGWWKFLSVLTSQKMRILRPKDEEEFWENEEFTKFTKYVYQKLPTGGLDN
jgi:hypothetical protein